MRKLMLLAVVLALALASVPAIAQVTDENEQSTDPTGDFKAALDISSSGNNSSQCVAPLQFGNTGNLQNDQNFLQYASTADDIQFEGSSFNFTPEQSVECDQKVQQSAAASN